MYVCLTCLSMSSDSSADSNDQMCWSFHASLAHIQCKHWPIPIPSYLKVSLSAKYQDAKEDGTKASWGRSKDTCNTVRAEYERIWNEHKRWTRYMEYCKCTGKVRFVWGGQCPKQVGFVWGVFCRSGIINPKPIPQIVLLPICNLFPLLHDQWLPAF